MTPWQKNGCHIFVFSFAIAAWVSTKLGNKPIAPSRVDSFRAYLLTYMYMASSPSELLTDFRLLLCVRNINFSLFSHFTKLGMKQKRSFFYIHAVWGLMGGGQHYKLLFCKRFIKNLQEILFWRQSNICDNCPVTRCCLYNKNLGIPRNVGFPRAI